jgi:hypothetical protein
MTGRHPHYAPSLINVPLAASPVPAPANPGWPPPPLVDLIEKVLEPFKNEKVHSMLALVAAKSRSFFWVATMYNRTSSSERIVRCAIRIYSSQREFKRCSAKRSFL